MQKDQTPVKKSAFIEALAASGSVTQACEAASVARCTPYAWRKVDEEFAKAWDNAFALGMDALEAELIRRAFKSDTTAAIFILKGNKPEKYKDRISSEISGPNGSPIAIDDATAADKLAALIAAAASRKGQDASDLA